MRNEKISQSSLYRAVPFVYTGDTGNVSTIMRWGYPYWPILKDTNSERRGEIFPGKGFLLLLGIAGIWTNQDVGSSSSWCVTPSEYSV